MNYTIKDVFEMLEENLSNINKGFDSDIPKNEDMNLIEGIEDLCEGFND